MQKIFSQELRFKDDNGKKFPKWEKKKMGDFVKLMADYQGNRRKILELANHIFNTNKFLMIAK